MLSAIGGDGGSRGTTGEVAARTRAALRSTKLEALKRPYLNADLVSAPIYLAAEEVPMVHILLFYGSIILCTWLALSYGDRWIQDIIFPF